MKCIGSLDVVMKIYVNKVPTEPKECLFARKVFIEDKTNKLGIAWCYYCNVNMKRCNIDCGGKCNKLRVPT